MWKINNAAKHQKDLVVGGLFPPGVKSNSRVRVQRKLDMHQLECFAREVAWWSILNPETANIVVEYEVIG